MKINTKFQSEIRYSAILTCQPNWRAVANIYAYYCGERRSCRLPIPPPHIIRTMSANGHYFNVFPYNNGQEAQYPIPLVFLGTPKIGEPNVAQLKGLFASFQEESLIISYLKKAQYSLCSEMDKQNKYLVKGTVYEKMKFSQ